MPTLIPTRVLMSDNVKVPSVPSVPTTDGVWVEVMAYYASVP